MSTLDDKIMGEKSHYYCSSSDEDEAGSNDESSEHGACCKPSSNPTVNEASNRKWQGSSTNTGPKGVLKDWQRFKQLEAEKRAEQELERMELVKKLSLTCQSHKDEEKELQLEQEIRELVDDKILEEFKRKRMQEMMSLNSRQPCFGTLIKLTTGQEFLDAVDNEKSVNVVMYIYREGDKQCNVMHRCIEIVARDYPQVKFCSMEVSKAGMSKHFKNSGVPALLVYKNGNLIGNFVRLTDDLGDDFVPSDVESFLIEHGLLPDNNSLDFSKLLSKDQS